ncbi:MAG: D-alanine--D-alanine ligase [Bacteroidales bacterium]
MNNKIRLAIICGGQSPEHDVSLQSTKNIIKALNKKKYEVILIYIDKKGKWYLNVPLKFLYYITDYKLLAGDRKNKYIASSSWNRQKQLISPPNFRSIKQIDVVFPVLHGPMGEDGTIQGLLKLANVPFVGSGILGSAVGMDKDIMKRLFRDAGIPTARFFVLYRTNLHQIKFNDIKHLVGLPFFVKPANLGSSVGVSKVKNEEQFNNALEEAFKYDKKILIEEYIEGREVECAVLGNENPIASVPGEIIPQHEFYSYEAKYIDEKGAIIEIPAKLPISVIKEIQALAIKAFKVICCEGMARVDFFIKNDKKIILNEVNTIPGFTKISMYPKLWEVSGLSFAKLIDKLVQLAIDRHKKENKLKKSFK